MANQYLIEIGMNDSLQDVIRKANHNFKSVSGSQAKTAQGQLRNTVDGIQVEMQQALDEKVDAGDLATVAFTGDYDDLDNKLEIEEISDQEIHDLWDGFTPSPAPGPGGTTDYSQLTNKPSIEGTTLVGDLELEDIGVSSLGNAKILALFS